MAAGPSIAAPFPADAGREGAPVLRAQDLTVRFGGLAALNNVNFEVRRGEIRAIIGPNGAGKSTFFNCLTGVLRPLSGRILFQEDCRRVWLLKRQIFQIHTLDLKYWLIS